MSRNTRLQYTPWRCRATGARRWTPVAAAMAFAAALWTGPALADDALEGRHVTVSGEGSVRARPDLAVATLGVSAHALTAAEAVAESRRLMSAVVQSLRQVGIAEADVLTTDFSIHRERVHPSRLRGAGDGEPEERFVVRNMLSVTIRDLDRAGLVLDRLIDAGANQVQGIRFALEDDRVMADRARELASQDARHRAEQLARLQGARLGRVLRISESGMRPVHTEAMMMKTADTGSSTVSAGELTLSAQLHVIYELKD